MGGHHGDVGGAVPVGELGLRRRRLEPYDVGDAQLGGQVGRCAGWPGRCRSAADARHHEPRAQRGVVVEHAGGGAEQHVGGLQRLDPADEQQDVGVGGRPSRRRASTREPLGGSDAANHPINPGATLVFDATVAGVPVHVDGNVAVLPYPSLTADASSGTSPWARSPWPIPT